MEYTTRSGITAEKNLRTFKDTFGYGSDDLIQWHKSNYYAYCQAELAMIDMLRCYRTLEHKGLSDREIARLMGLPKTTLRRQIMLLMKSKKFVLGGLVKVNPLGSAQPHVYAIDLLSIKDLAMFSKSITDQAYSDKYGFMSHRDFVTSESV